MRTLLSTTRKTIMLGIVCSLWFLSQTAIPPIQASRNVSDAPANKTQELLTPTPMCLRWGGEFNSGPSGYWDRLNGVVAISPSDVWAVGVRDGDVRGTQTLTMHWDG